MKNARKISALLVGFTSFGGLVRGFRLINPESFPTIIYPFSEDLIRDSLYTNYTVLGWILFFLVGVFGVVTILCLYIRHKIYPYLMIIQGIFISFLTLTHLLYTGFGPIHIVLLPLGISTILLGVVQTPREF